VTTFVTCIVPNRRNGDRCTAEALDPDADVLICAKHAAAVLDSINARFDSAGLLVAGSARIPDPYSTHQSACPRSLACSCTAPVDVGLQPHSERKAV